MHYYKADDNDEHLETSVPVNIRHQQVDNATGPTSIMVRLDSLNFAPGNVRHQQFDNDAEPTSNMVPLDSLTFSHTNVRRQQVDNDAKPTSNTSQFDSTHSLLATATEVPDVNSTNATDSSYDDPLSNNNRAHQNISPEGHTIEEAQPHHEAPIIDNSNNQSDNINTQILQCVLNDDAQGLFDISQRLFTNRNDDSAGLYQAFQARLPGSDNEGNANKPGAQSIQNDQ